MTYRLGVDIGGTFTDVVLLRDDGAVLTAKVLSTPDDYARGVVAGAEALLAQHAIPASDLEGLVHAPAEPGIALPPGLDYPAALRPYVEDAA